MSQKMACAELEFSDDSFGPACLLCLLLLVLSSFFFSTLVSCSLHWNSGAMSQPLAVSQKARTVLEFLLTHSNSAFWLWFPFLQLF